MLEQLHRVMGRAGVRALTVLSNQLECTGRLRGVLLIRLHHERPFYHEELSMASP